MIKLIDFYNKNDYKSVLEYFSDNQINNNIEYLVLGIVLFEMGHIIEGLNIINKINYNFNMPEHIKVKAITLKGLYFYSQGKYKDSFLLLKSCNSKITKRWIDLLKLDEIDKNFKSKKIEFPAINFHFEQTIKKEDKINFIYAYNKKLVEIYKFFRFKLSKNIDVYIYNDKTDVLGNNLSYANNFLNTIYTNLENELGHELAHIAISSLQKGKKTFNKFINEGIAEVFNDINYKNKFIINKSNNIIDLCDNNEHLSIQELMLIGKIFFSYLLEKFGNEKIIYLSKNQSKQDLLKIYGEKVYQANRYTLLQLKKRNFKIRNGI